MDKQALIAEIDSFLSQHARLSSEYDPSFDSQVDRYKAAGARTLWGAARDLEAGRVPRTVFADFAPQGYTGSEHSSARLRHDAIMTHLGALRIPGRAAD